MTLLNIYMTEITRRKRHRICRCGGWVRRLRWISPGILIRFGVRAKWLPTRNVIALSELRCRNIIHQPLPSLYRGFSFLFVRIISFLKSRFALLVPADKKAFGGRRGFVRLFRQNANSFCSAHAAWHLMSLNLNISLLGDFSFGKVEKLHGELWNSNFTSLPIATHSHTYDDEDERWGNKSSSRRKISFSARMDNFFGRKTLRAAFPSSEERNEKKVKWELKRE